MCGIVGAVNIPDIYANTFKMMMGVDHRGGNGAGVVFEMGGSEPVWERTEFSVPELARKIAHRNFDKSCYAMGHLRYGTAGDRRSQSDAQPLKAEIRNGKVIYIGHNGDSPYMEEDRQHLIDQGCAFSTSSDSEIMLHHMALSKSNDLLGSIKEGLQKYRGTYSLTMLVEDDDGVKLIAARDISGNRPLILGRLGSGYVTVSEDVALEKIGAVYERDIMPGELLIISKNGLQQDWIYPKPQSGVLRQCNYELDYLAYPSSKIFGIPVGEYRRLLGRFVAKRYGHLVQSGDVVTHVPESGKFYALGFCEAIQCRYEELILRSHHSDRSFMQESQEMVEDAIRLKFSFMRHTIERILKSNPEAGILVVDDSMVRGNIARKITHALRSFGFKRVGWCFGVPALLGPCHKGMDLPGKGRKLIAPQFMKSDLIPDSERIAREVGADFVGYPFIQDLRDAIRYFGKNPDDFCYGCFENRDPIWNKW